MKLVRDKVAEKVLEQGGTILKISEPDQIRRALAAKLSEEVSEFLEAVKDKTEEDQFEELGDVWDVLETFQKFLINNSGKIHTSCPVQHSRQTKQNKKGCFEGMNYMIRKKK